MRFALKVCLGLLVVGLAMIALTLVSMSIGADRLDTAWTKKIPIESSPRITDGKSSSIVGPVGKRFIGLYKGPSGELLWRYALDLFAEGPIVKAATVSEDGKTIAAANVSGKIFFFDRFANLAGSMSAAGPTAELYLSGDGRRLIQVTEEGDAFLGAAGSDVVQKLSLKGRPLIMDLNQSGDHITVATKENLKAISADGNVLWVRPVAVKQISADGGNNAIAVITKSGALHVYKKNGRLDWSYRPDRQQPRLDSVAIAANGKYVAAASGANMPLYLFAGDGRLVKMYMNPSNQSGILSFVDEGKVLISGDRGKFTGLLTNESIARIVSYDRAKQSYTPIILFLLALVVIDITLIRRVPKTKGSGDIIKWPRQIGEENTRKVA